jgi:hypothetical protein
MTTTRIVLSAKHKPYAEELLAITGIDSLSNLFVILLTRYKSHLRASWDVLQPGVGEALSATPALNLPVQHSVTQSQNNHQPIMVIPEPEPETIDPVIAHIAQHIDRF